MRRYALVALVGASVGMSGMETRAQDTSAPAKATPLPPVEVVTPGSKPKTAKKKSAAKKSAPPTGQTGAVQAPASGASGSGGTGIGAALNADLGTDSVANPYRVAPSSRQHTQVFTQEDIKRLNPKNVFDLLSQATGVLPTYMGRKHVFNLSIRGDSNFGYIIDGAYLPSFIGGRILQSLPVSAIEQIEIVRDGSALTLGPLTDFISASGALNSGFIVIRTRRPVKTEVDARAAIESYGTQKASVFTGTTFDAKSIKNNGWFGYVAGVGGYSTTDGPDGWNMWADSKNLMGKIGLGKGGFFTEAMVYKDYGSYGFERGTSALAGALPYQKWSYDPIDTLFFSSNTRMAWDKHNTTLLTVALNEVEQENVLDTFDASKFKAMPTNYETDKLQTVNLRHRLAFGGTLLEAGGQYVHWHSPTGELYFVGREREEETWSGYVNAEQKLFGDVLTLDASGRVDDHTVIKGIESYGESVSGASSTCRTSCAYIYDKDFPLAKSLSLGASLAMTREITTTMRYSRTTQGGTSNILVAANTMGALDGAVQNKWEAGVTANYTPLFIPTLTYFDTRVDNDKVPYGYTTVSGVATAMWTQANTHRAGIELAVTGTILDKGFPGKISYSAGWTHLTMFQSSSRDSTVDFYYPSTKPEDIINFSISGEYGAYFANVSLNHVSSYLSNFNTGSSSLYNPVGDFDVVNANIGRHFQLGEWDSKLTLYGRNLLNENYETVNGYEAIGAVYGSEISFTY